MLFFAAAQSNLLDACREIITSGLREYDISTESNEYLNTVFDQYCESSGSAKSQGFGVGLDLIVGAIPIRLTGNYSSNEEAMRNFCSTYSSVASGSSDSTRYSEKIVREAYDTFGQCIAIAQTGISLRHEVVGLEKLNFFLAPGFVRPVTIRGVDISSPNIQCEGLDPNTNEPAITFNSDTRITIGADKTLGMVCTRTSESGENGEEVFREGSVTVLTDIAPSGNYSVFLPRDARLPEAQASVLERTIAELQAELVALRGEYVAADQALNSTFSQQLESTVKLNTNYQLYSGTNTGILDLRRK